MLNLLKAFWRNPQFYMTRAFPGILAWATFCLLLPQIITKGGANGLGGFVALGSLFVVLWLFHFPAINMYPNFFGHTHLDPTESMAKWLYLLRYTLKAAAMLLTLAPALGAIMGNMQAFILGLATALFLGMEGNWLWSMKKAEARGKEDVEFVFVKDWNDQRRQ